jgi:membrane-bound lytic murein transglycosylase D
MPLETVQYVLGVGEYRTVLKLYDASLRDLAKDVALTAVRKGEDWEALAARLEVPEWELRMHNPFLAQRRLRARQSIAYPMTPGTGLFRLIDDDVEYRMRHGDNYLKLALTLGVELNALRAENGLWHVQSLPPGAPVRIPLAADRKGLLHVALGLPPSSRGTPAVVRTALKTAAPPPTAAVFHRVSRGDTLTSVARRYGTTIRAIQRANGMGRRTRIQAGARLRIPASSR